MDWGWYLLYYRQYSEMEETNMNLGLEIRLEFMTAYTRSSKATGIGEQGSKIQLDRIEEQC